MESYFTSEEMTWLLVGGSVGLSASHFLPPLPLFRVTANPDCLPRSHKHMCFAISPPSISVFFIPNLLSRHPVLYKIIKIITAL